MQNAAADTALLRIADQPSLEQWLTPNGGSGPLKPTLRLQAGV